MKTSLADADTVYSLDLLNYKSGRLELLGNQIAVADGFAEALFELDLEQDTVTAENQEKRKSDAENALEQCVTMIHSKRVGIQEKFDAEGQLWIGPGSKRWLRSPRPLRLQRLRPRGR